MLFNCFVYTFQIFFSVKNNCSKLIKINIAILWNVNLTYVTVLFRKITFQHAKKFIKVDTRTGKTFLSDGSKSLDRVSIMLENVTKIFILDNNWQYPLVVG